MAQLPLVLPDLRRLRRAARLLLCTAVVLLVVVAACGPSGPDATPLAPEVLSRLGAAGPPLVLDVRSAVELAAGHAPGARSAVTARPRARIGP